MSDEWGPAKVGWWGRHSGRLVVLGLLVFALVLWPFSDWEMWAWVFGLGATILVGLTLGAIGARDRLGPTWILSAGLVVVVLFLIGNTTPAVWGLGAGIVLTLLGMVAVSGKVGWPRRVWLGALICGPVLLIVCAVVITYGAVQLHRQQEQEEQQAHEFYASKLLPTPRGGTIMLVEAIGLQQRTQPACQMFTDHARQQFAAANGARDCAGAIANLHRQVTDANRYVHELWIPNDATTTIGPTTIV